VSSIHRQNGKPNWFCAFYDIDAEGNSVRRFKSTGTTNQKQAQKICDAMQKAAHEIKRGRLTPDRARAIIEEKVAEIADAHGIELPRQSTKQFLEGWLKSKGGSESTRDRYKDILDSFTAHLGPKASHSLQRLTDQDIIDWRDKLSKKVSASTVNLSLKVLRMALNRAVAQNKLTRSPSAGVDNIEGATHERKPFTDAQIKKILEVASDEWRTAIFVGYYTSLRLGDVASLTWSNIDLQKAMITMTEQKTGELREMEIAGPLLRHLESLPATDNPNAPLCPALHGKRVGTVSNQFYDIMASVGLVPERDHKSKAKGRGTKRQLSPLSFHSIRHTSVSKLKNAGVSNAVAQDIVGHASEAVSRQYTHIESDTRRKALDKLPDITK
jgi:integrase